jgi:outer membrane protein assembly factor BamB
MPPIPLNFPNRGVTNAPAFIKTPGDAAPIGTTYNVLPDEAITGRMRGSKRMGIVRVFPQPIGPGPVQGLGVITRASSVSGQRLGSSVDMDSAASKDATGISGQVWGMDAAPSLDFMYRVDVTSSGPFADDGAMDNGVQAMCLSAKGRGLNLLQKAGKFLAVASNYFSLGDGFGVARIVLFNTETGRMIGTARLSQPGGIQNVNTMVMSDRALYVCTNHWVNVYRVADESAEGLQDGLTPLSESAINCNGWAQEVIQAGLSPNGSYLYVAFNGTSTGATLASGALVTAGINATHFRSGIMRYHISSDAPYLTPEAWGTQLPSTARYYEGGTSPHNYWRMSEQLDRAPQGGYVTALKVAADGSILLTHTNTGRGPDNNPAHVTDYRAPQGPSYKTVTKILADGRIAWSTDTFSIRDANDQGKLNDIPTPPDDFHYPSIQAVDVDEAGFVYVAGNLSTGLNVYKLDKDNGVILWAQNAGAVVPQAGICIGPGGQPVVCAFRNDDWEDGSHVGEDRILFTLDPETGDVLSTYDLAEPVSALCVAAANGRLFFGTDSVL